MFAQDLPARHRLCALQRHKRRCVRVDGFIMYGKSDIGNTVHAHRNRLPLASEIPREFFLRLDDIFQHRIVDRFSGNHEGDDVRTDVLQFGVHGDDAVFGIFYRIGSRHEFLIIRVFCSIIQGELPRDADRRPQVGTIGIVEFDFNNALIFRLGRIGFFVEFGFCAGQFFFKRIVIVFFPEQSEKTFFVDFDFRHFYPRNSRRLL